MSVPKAKRTYLRADDRRAQILEVAKGVFAEHGYHRANIADVCEAAGIGRGTLYQYFDNKQAVLLALLEDVLARVKDVLAHRPRVKDFPAARSAPPALIAEFCRRRIRELLDAVFVDEPTLRLVLREARNLDGAVDDLIARIDRVLLQAMEADLKGAQQLGLMRTANVRLVARFLLGGVEKIVLTALASGEAIDLDAVARTAVDLELFGLLSEEVRRQ
jgi:TetR/AcrR family fatty acid metabolism transcriptional regulator